MREEGGNGSCRAHTHLCVGVCLEHLSLQVQLPWTHSTGLCITNRAKCKSNKFAKNQCAINFASRSHNSYYWAAQQYIPNSAIMVRGGQYSSDESDSDWDSLSQAVPPASSHVEPTTSSGKPTIWSQFRFFFHFECWDSFTVSFMH